METSSYDLSVSNEELLRRCQEQDQEALQILFRRHERPVYGLLFRMLENREDAEEALAEVFVKVWRSAGRFRGESKFTTWLFRISANTARDMLRTRRGHQTVSLDDMEEWESESAMNSRENSEDPSDVLLRAEDRMVLTAALQKLNEDDRLLVTLYHLQERSYEEISQITGFPAANLKVKLFRARQRLRQHFETLSNGSAKNRPGMEKEGQEHELRKDTNESTGLQPPAVELP
ncbi:MAG: sigma-70 family RNA polymerase sigma factor [Armatimonadota bacterium]|nr:sigma-70 family RNA polymerase sigma factor [Armatimonadota bacterium]